MPTFPIAGAIASTQVLAPVDGGISLEPMSEGAVELEIGLATGELNLAMLRTSGHDDPELQALEPPVVEEPPAPPLHTKAFSIKIPAVAPAPAKPLPACDAATPVAAEPTRPRMVASALRTKMVQGPNPNKPVLKLKQAPPPPPAPAPAAKQQTPPPPAAPVQSSPPAPKQSAPAPSAPVKPAAPAITVKPAQPQITVKPAPLPIPEKPAAAAASAAAAAPATKPVESAKPVPSITVKVAEPPKPAPAPVVKPAEPEKPKVTAAPAAKVVEPEKPKAPEPEKPKAAPAPVEKTPEKIAPERQPDKPKINVRPTQPPPQPAKKVTPPAPSRPAIAASAGNTVPVQHEEPEVAPPPPPKPKVQPIRPASSPMSDVPMLGMEEPKGGMGMKIGIAAAVLVILGGGGFFLFKGGSSTQATAHAISDTPSDAPPALGAAITGAGWAPNWGSEAPNNKGRQLSLFRPTALKADYTIEFTGIIGRKSIGWFFRAHDSKNYCAEKLKIVKPAPDPAFALEKFCVVNGKEDVHTQVMLPNTDKTSVTAVWKIRTDVEGKKFTTYINDKLADYMTDDRIKLGGAGLFNDSGELGQVKNSGFFDIALNKK